MSDDLENKVDKLQELIELQDGYIKLLLGELEETVPTAHVHGWKSSVYSIEAGKVFRRKIKELREDV